MGKAYMARTYEVMVQKVRNRIVGTPMESLARRIHTQINPSVDAGYNRQILRVMKRLLSANSNCVDVGCARGTILREILRFAPEGTHYAFEPIPESYRELTDSFPDARVYQLALSDRPGLTTFHHIVDQPGDSGLRQRGRASKPIQVRQDTLDNIVDGEVPINFIKIDVEGAEFSVLKGATKTIRKDKPVIIFEHEQKGASFYETKPDAVYQLLSECGLRVSLIGKWLRNEEPLNLREFVQQYEDGTNINFIAYP